MKRSGTTALVAARVALPGSSVKPFLERWRVSNPSAPSARIAPMLSAEQAGGIASFALQFTGTPYVWGGSRPGAFDCSGFTKYVYGQSGLSLPHSAASQYSQNYGTFIDRGSLHPGDLVFFANTYKRGISHVGVYVGGGIVAQALAPGVPLSAVNMNSA